MSCPGVSHGNEPDALKNDMTWDVLVPSVAPLTSHFLQRVNISFFFSPVAQASIPYSNMSSLEP